MSDKINVPSRPVTVAPWVGLGELPFKETVSRVVSKAGPGGIYQFAKQSLGNFVPNKSIYNFVEWYTDKYGRKARVGSGSPILHMIALSAVIGYMWQKPRYEGEITVFT